MADNKPGWGGILSLVGTIVYVLGYALYAISRGTVVQTVIFCVTLQGLIAFAASLHNTLRQTENVRPLVNLAFGSVLLAVVFETVGWSLAAAASHSLTDGYPASGMALLAGADVLRRLLFLPLGVFIAITCVAVLTSRSFPRWVGWLGLVSGIIIVVFGIISGLAITSQQARSILDNWFTVLGFVAFLGFGVWMLTSSIIMFWRDRNTQTRESTEIA